MAKELPYFRFTAAEWLNDDISLESYEIKGIFADVCAYYWSQDCEITLAKLQKRFSNATILLQQLIESDIIKHENKHDKIKIDFLLIQYDLLSEKRKSRQDAGSKGGIATAKAKQKVSYKDNNKDKDKDNNKLDFILFWSLYPVKVAKTKAESKWKKLTIEDQQKIIDTLPAFIKNKPFESYNHPNPETYFNQKRWEDEINENININQSKKEYRLSCADGSYIFTLTEVELVEKMKSGWWKLI
jgi:hypothetical protein